MRSGWAWSDSPQALRGMTRRRRRTAAEAMTVLERAHAFWQGLLHELPADSWWEPLGPAAGPYAEDDKASLVLHQLDEQIHHGAELGVLRDLYLHSRTLDKAAEPGH